MLIDGNTGRPMVPQGTLGHRFSEDGKGRWNLDLQGADPQLSLHGRGEGVQEILLPRFDAVSTPAEDEAHNAHSAPGTMRRGVPTTQVNGRTVTTVYDLLLASYGISRDGLPGTWPTGYDDPSEVGTPAWQERITGVPAAQVQRLSLIHISEPTRLL